MLGVFERSIAKQPMELLSASVHLQTQIKTKDDISNFYLNFRKDTDTTFYKFLNGNFMALSQTDEQPPQPRSIMVKDDIYCIFFGSLENASDLWKFYGFSGEATEAMIVFAAYKMLKDIGSFSPDYIIKEFKGAYSFMLFDSKSSVVFLARDRMGGVEFHWGTCADGSLVCCDDPNVISSVCGPCYTPFPQGCIFLNMYGLISFDHPYHLVKGIKHKDEGGMHRAIIFQVDLQSRQGIHNCTGVGDNSAIPLSSRTRDNNDDDEQALVFL